MVGRAKVICSFVNFNLKVRRKELKVRERNEWLTDRRFSHVSMETWHHYPWAKYLVVSSAINAMREMFLATTLVLWEAAINQAALEVCSRLSAKEMRKRSTLASFPTLFFKPGLANVLLIGTEPWMRSETFRFHLKYLKRQSWKAFEIQKQKRGRPREFRNDIRKVWIRKEKTVVVSGTTRDIELDSQWIEKKNKQWQCPKVNTGI